MSNQGQGQHIQSKQVLDSISLKKGDIVWAKVRGYSWWPAKVGEVHSFKKGDKERKYLVQFIGDNTHQTLPQTKIADFIDNYHKYAQTKKKALVDSIDTAKKMLKKDEQVQLQQKLQNSEKNQKCSEKSGINDKDEVAKIEKSDDRIVKQVSKGHNQVQQSSDGVKNSELFSNQQKITNQQQEVQPLNTNGKRNQEQEQLQTDQDRPGKKRTLKAKVKEQQKQKKEDVSEEKVSDEGENDEEDDSQIINTKPKRGGKIVQIGKRNKRRFSDSEDDQVNEKSKENSNTEQKNNAEDDVQGQESPPKINIKPECNDEINPREQICEDRLEEIKALEQQQVPIKEKRQAHTAAKKFIHNAVHNRYYDKDKEDSPQNLQSQHKALAAHAKQESLKNIHAQKQQMQNHHNVVNEHSIENQQLKRENSMHSHSHLNVAKTNSSQKDPCPKKQDDATLNMFCKISKHITNLIKKQQKEEKELIENIHIKHNQEPKQILKEINKRSLMIIHQNIISIRQYLMELFRAQINTPILYQSKIGKHLKYFVEFCNTYASDMLELGTLASQGNAILVKWKNYVNNTMFDENVDHKSNFIKNKSQKKLKKIVNTKSEISVTQTTIDQNSIKYQLIHLLTKAAQIEHPEFSEEDHRSSNDGPSIQMQRTERKSSSLFEEYKNDNGKIDISEDYVLESNEQIQLNQKSSNSSEESLKNLGSIKPVSPSRFNLPRNISTSSQSPTKGSHDPQKQDLLDIKNLINQTEMQDIEQQQNRLLEQQPFNEIDLEYQVTQEQFREPTSDNIMNAQVREIEMKEYQAIVGNEADRNLS